jgi:type 2 lantibiotic biosynthesis protein LanM
MTIDENTDNIIIDKKTANELFARTAANIGTKICKQAFWSGSRCNWISKTVNAMDGGVEGSYTIENQALGPSLYEGTSGISLFLAYLYLYTKRDDYYVTAKGAINQALSLVEEVPLLTRFGFYTGHIGIAYAATKVGIALNDDSLLERANTILKNLQLKSQDDHLLDLISGNAGAIPALLHIYYNVFHDQKIFDLALQLGNELLSSAVKESIGWSWPATSIETQHNLTGFSHGAAGMGYGLLELYNKTEKKEFRHGAEQAFAYENHWFNPEHDNWPDFRILSREKGNSSTDVKDLVYSTSWCHGAPGIGFSRLHAYQILKDESYLKDLQACLRTAVKLLKEGDDGGGFVNSKSNYCLCHGLSGICEFLICSNELINDDSYRSLVVNVATRGVEQYTNNDQPWPCGIVEGETVNLMLGLAGIGYFYLRMSDSVLTPSILMITGNDSKE